MIFDCIKKIDKLDIESCEVYWSQSFEVKLFRPGGGGGKRHPMGKFVKPTFLAQFWGADYENLC